MYLISYLTTTEPWLARQDNLGLRLYQLRSQRLKDYQHQVIRPFFFML